MNGAVGALASLTVVVCAVLLARLALPWRRRERFDAAAARLWWRLRAVPERLRRRRRPPAPHGDASERAEREALEAIERARRRSADVDGNVIRPKSFRGPRKPH